MKRIGSIISVILFTAISMLFSGDFPWNFEELLFLTPFSHYESIEGERAGNFLLDFEGINLTSPIDGSPFLIPSPHLFSDLKSNTLFSPEFYISENKSSGKIGFYRDGLSLKSGETTDIRNSLFYSNNISEKIFFNVSVLNSGNSYYHYDNVFHGPAAELFMKYRGENSVLNFYSFFSKTNDSSLELDELEPPQKVKFKDDAFASHTKLFTGFSYTYDNSTLKFSSKLSYGLKNQDGEKNGIALFDSETNSWSGNFPFAVSSSFLTIKNSISLNLSNEDNFKLFPSLNFEYLSGKTKREISGEGIIYDNSIKISGYGYELNSSLIRISPEVHFSKGLREDSISFTLKIGYELLWYPGGATGESIFLNSPEILSKIDFKAEKIKGMIGISYYSTPITLAKLFPLSNNFFNYKISFFENGIWNDIEITPNLKYHYDNSSSYNRTKKAFFSLSYGDKNSKITFNSVLSKTSDFWDRMDTSSSYIREGELFIKTNNGESINIGTPSKEKDNILFSPERTFLGLNLNLLLNSESLKFIAGVTYMKTTGTYDNQYVSILGGYGSNSIIFLSPNIQNRLIDNFDLTFGNGIKLYSRVKYIFSENLIAELFFVHLPPVNYFTYTSSISSIGYVPDSREKSTPYNNLSIGFDYSLTKIKVYLYVKNILNSTAPLLFPVNDSSEFLKTTTGMGLFVGLVYSL